MKHPFSFGVSATLLLVVLVGRNAQAQVKLSWKDNSSNETQFTIERTTSAAGPWVTYAQTGANTTTYTDNATAAGVTYYYRVKASNSSWTSQYTNLSSKSIPAAVIGGGTGLLGHYYRDTAFSTLVQSRTDAQVNFDWGEGSPLPSVPSDNFTARWSGSVLTQEGGTYNFTTETDEGVRLWINGVLVIDKWATLGTFAAPLTLAANTKYSFKMEYKELTGSAFARLKWTKPGASVAVLIPKSQLFPS